MPNVTVEREGGAAIVTLNRPERRNALSLELMRELNQTLAALDGEAGVRAVILAASGQVFSSGHDLSEMTGRTLDHYRALFAECTALMQRVQTVRQPVIAEVQGLATAAGCQLAATCDLVVAGEHARFATPGVRIGLFCSTPMVALTRAIGRKRAMEMLLTGREVAARTAADWGLVNQVVPAEELRPASLALAAAIAAASAYTVAVGKQAFYRQIDEPQASAYATAQEIMSANACAADAQEGIGAFLGKRAPVWSGR